MADAPEETLSDGSDVVKRLYIFAGVAFLITGAIYWTLWKRGQQNRSTDVANQESTEEMEEQEERSEERPKFTHAWIPKEREPGDPIYDVYIIGGTASLGICLWVGATIVLVASLVERSNFHGASASDFQSLGTRGCRIDSTVNYKLTTKKLNALNSVCVEEWEYLVEVVDPMETFISVPMAAEDCRRPCEMCANSLHGPNHYVGFDHLRRGRAISNQTFVECFAPTRPVEELSDFYDCGQQNGTCYVLEDTSGLLKDSFKSVQLGLMATYVGYGVGIVLLLLVARFMQRNRQVHLAALRDQDNKEEETPCNETRQDSQALRES